MSEIDHHDHLHEIGDDELEAVIAEASRQLKKLRPG